MKLFICAFAKDKLHAEGIARGFRSLRHEVFLDFPDRGASHAFSRLTLRLPFKRTAASYWETFKKKVNRRILARIGEARPDVVLSIGGEQVYRETISAILRRHRIPVACWLADDPATLDPNDSYRWMNFLNYSHLFAVDELWAESLKLLPTAKTALPFAGDDELFRPGSSAKDIDVLFVGGMFPPHPHTATGYVRAKILHALKQERLVTAALIPGAEKLRYFFPGLARGIGVRGVKTLPQTNQLLNRAKVVVYVNTILLKADFDAMLYNIALSGSFVITDHKTNAGSLFGGQLVTAEDSGQFVEKVRYYLAHESEREERARNVRQVALARHTYAERAKTLLQHIT